MVVVFDDVRHLEVKRVTSTNAKRIDVLTCGVRGDGVIDLVNSVSLFLVFGTNILRCHSLNSFDLSFNLVLRFEFEFVVIDFLRSDVPFCSLVVGGSLYFWWKSCARLHMTRYGVFLAVWDV